VSGRSGRTRARLSQNLFVGDVPARRLVAAAQPPMGMWVYDLGAGTGRVTAALLVAGARVVAIERDPNLARKLCTRFAGSDVRVIEGDLAEVRFTPPFVVVANPPFNQTAVLLRRLLFEAPPPEAATLVLQREAAERYAGRYGSALSLMAQPWFELAVTYPFSRRDFIPIPAVEVAVLRIVRRATPLLENREAQTWRAFVRGVFARGRPDARGALRNLLSGLQWRRLSADLAIPAGATLTGLSLSQWTGLFRFVAAYAPARRRAVAFGLPDTRMGGRRGGPLGTLPGPPPTPGED
jgi:23S rRNA (adenine-N6)-dimethyltransferase